MKKLEVSEQFVKEAYESACQTWKERIKEEFPSLFGVKLEKNKWYKCKEYNNLVFYCSDGCENYGITFVDNEWSNNLWVKEYYTWELATPTEIESMLWKEAEKRGIGKDTKIEKSLTQFGEQCSNDGGYAICYDYNYDELWNKNGCIYKQGKWTTPLDPNKEIKETISRLEKELKELKEKVK